MPKQTQPVQPVSPPSATDLPLLDPWAGSGRRNASRPLEPELRDPFRGIRPRHDGPRLAHADLRDPFARSPGSPAGRGAARSEPAPAAAPEPAMPLHPDLRDPFGRRKGRPTPPPSEGVPAPAPRPVAPSTAASS